MVPGRRPRAQLPARLAVPAPLAGKWSLIDFGSLSSTADVKGINAICRRAAPLLACHAMPLLLPPPRLASGEPFGALVPQFILRCKPWHPCAGLPRPHSSALASPSPPSSSASPRTVTGRCITQQQQQLPPCMHGAGWRPLGCTMANLSASSRLQRPASYCGQMVNSTSSWLCPACCLLQGGGPEARGGRRRAPRPGGADGRR